MLSPRLIPIVTVLVFPLLHAQDDPAPPDTSDPKAMYEAWCARCHGSDGRGLVEGLELDTPVPDFTDCSFTSREPRSDWLAVILDGGPARGLAMTMPAWREALNEHQAEAIINHIKTFCTDSGWPPGELNFRRAHRTTKAFPENEALVIPTYDRSRFDTKFVYERRIGSAGQWEIALPFASASDPGGGSGLGDAEVAGKYVLHFDESSASILSLGLEVGVPMGDETRRLGAGHWKVAPFLAGAKGWGRITLQTSVKTEKVLGTSEVEVSYNVALTLPLTREKMGLYPMIELNGVTEGLNGATALFVTPQIYAALVRRGHIAVSVGAQIPLTRYRPFEYRILGFFLWEYADGGLWW